MEFLKALFKFLERFIPGFLVGLRVGEIGKDKLEADVARAKLALELKKNEIEVLQSFDGQSSDDIVNAIISGKRE